MATWREVYHLLAEGCGPETIMGDLRLKPYRFHQILNCKHIRDRLEDMEGIRMMFARHWVLRQFGPVCEHVAGIALSAENPRTALDACKVVIKLAREALKVRAQERAQARARAEVA